MRCVPGLSLLLLLAPVVLCGQDAAAKANRPGTMYEVPLQLQTPETGARYKLSAENAPSQFQRNSPPSADVCPVSLRAQRQGTAVMRNTGDQRQDSTPAQRLELTLVNAHMRNVVSAVIKVHGLDGSVQAMPVDPIRRGAHEVTRTIALNVSVLSMRSASTELTMRSFGTVSRIEVESVEFADGTSWKAAEQGLCSFTPELYMLVGSR
jgi:hypothetical protein